MLTIEDGKNARLTWRMLRDYLNTHNGDVLDQQVEVIGPSTNHEAVIPLQIVQAIGTIADMIGPMPDLPVPVAVQTTRSSDDNKHHPERLVFLVDWNPFNEDGSVGEDLETGEAVFPLEKTTDD